MAIATREPGITDREVAQVEAANASGKTPVVFIHGLWLLPSSWDNWVHLFEENGYAGVTPSWPDDPETVEEARANPEVFARKTVGPILHTVFREAVRVGKKVREETGMDRGRLSVASVGRFVQGAGGVFALIGAAYLAMTYLPASRAATLIGLTQMFGMAGGSAGQFLVGPAIGAGLAWDRFWLIMGLIGLPIAVLLFLFIPKPKPRPASTSDVPWWKDAGIAKLCELLVG